MVDVVELFAGVGGFRLGLEGLKKSDDQYYSSLSDYRVEIKQAKYFNTILSNQFEPNSKKQIASLVYTKQFGKTGHLNVDIRELNAIDILKYQSRYGDEDRPIMVVGGFPCQDYSVGTLLKNSKGLKGEKGVLWWEINRLLMGLKALNKSPKYLLFENVDRLLKSPVKSRGSDFATILYCLGNLGYTVEYQSINAADLGFVQKRSRVFILAYFGKPQNILKNAFNPTKIAPADSIKIPQYKFSNSNIGKIQKKFKGLRTSPFLNGGILYGESLIPHKAEFQTPKKIVTFEDIRIDESSLDIGSIIIPENSLCRWQKAKGKKRIKRFKPDGTTYFWSEGSMELFQQDDKPLRTIITSEGGLSPSRTRHLIQLKQDIDGHKFRVLHRLEMERSNMFPDNFTSVGDITTKQVGFLMGNALVVGIVEIIRNCILAVENNK